MLPSYARSWFKSRLAFSRQSRCAFDSTFGLHASLRGKAPPILERLNRRGDFQHRIPHGRQPVAFVGLRKQFRFHHAHGLRKSFALRKKEGVIRDFIPGEAFTIFNPIVLELLDVVPQLRADTDLANTNEGVTVLWLK
jgi:hypothetical protein